MVHGMLGRDIHARKGSWNDPAGNCKWLHGKESQRWMNGWQKFAVTPAGSWGEAQVAFFRGWRRMISCGG